MGFNNSSYYIIPGKTDSVDELRNKLNSDKAWRHNDNQGYNYVYNYVSDIGEKTELSSNFTYVGGDKTVLTFNEYTCAHIESINIWIFGTGIVFTEILVDYGDMPAMVIPDFAYNFKRVKYDYSKIKLTVGEDSKQIKVLDYISSVIPNGISLFPYMRDNIDDFRKMCTGMHMIYAKEANEINDSDKIIYALKRNYNFNFANDSDTEIGSYDDTYNPHTYMKWAFSQEGMVCLCTQTDNESTNRFLDGFMYSQHLLKEYHFLYLVLLNIRFSALDYIKAIADAGDSIKKVQDITRNIISLKTKYWFRVVSDDMIYQNVYAKMYNIMEVDDMLRDIEENSEQLNVLNIREEAKKNDIIQISLLGLSCLAIFSALIDLTSYIGEVKGGNSIGFISFIIVIAIIIGFAGWGVYKYIKGKRH